MLGSQEVHAGISEKPNTFTAFFKPSTKTNLSGFSVMPFRPHVSNDWTAWTKLSLMESSHTSKSSTHFFLLELFDTNSSYRHVYPSPDAM